MPRSKNQRRHQSDKKKFQKTGKAYHRSDRLERRRFDDQLLETDLDFHKKTKRVDRAKPKHADQTVSRKNNTLKCSTAQSAEDFVNRLGKVGDRLNIHHIYPQSRAGVSWEIAEKGFIIHRWNELRVSERKHVCFNVLFEMLIQAEGVNFTVSRTPQEACKQIEMWGDASGKIDFNKINPVQIVAWAELFGLVDTVKDAIDLIKREWDIQPKWQNVCKELFMLKVRRCERNPYWFVRNHELKLAISIASARYRKERDRFK